VGWCEVHAKVAFPFGFLYVGFEIVFFVFFGIGVILQLCNRQRNTCRRSYKKWRKQKKDAKEQARNEIFCEDLELYWKGQRDIVINNFILLKLMPIYGYFVEFFRATLRRMLSTFRPGIGLEKKKEDKKKRYHDDHSTTNFVLPLFLLQILRRVSFFEEHFRILLLFINMDTLV
jgi:hypothetical protein